MGSNGIGDQFQAHMRLPVPICHPGALHPGQRLDHLEAFSQFPLAKEDEWIQARHTQAIQARFPLGSQPLEWEPGRPVMATPISRMWIALQ